MRIVIDMGHTPTSPGASGYLDELSCDRAAGPRIIAELERRGHTVFNSTPEDWVAYPDEVNQRCYYTNSLSNIDLFCSLHLNAGGGHGTEVLYYAGDPTGQAYAARISDNVARSMGITDRGAKPNDWVGVIVNTNPTAVLIEFCFVDSYDDAQAWWATSWNDLVNAVCDGIEMKVWNKNAIPAPAPEPEPEPNGGDMRPADVWEYDWQNTAPGGNMYNCAVSTNNCVLSTETKIDALTAMVKKITTPTIDYDKLATAVAGKLDYAKMAKAVNDDHAKRMQS